MAEEIKKEEKATPPEGGQSPTPPSETAVARDTQKTAVEGEKTQEGLLGGDVEETIDQLLQQFTGNGEEEPTQEPKVANNKLEELGFTQDELEAISGFPGLAKLLADYGQTKKRLDQEIVKRLQTLESRFIENQYRSQLNELESSLGRKITKLEAELLFAVGNNMINQGKDFTLQALYDSYIKPLVSKAETEEEKKRVLAEQIEKAQSAPQVEGGGAGVPPEVEPKDYEQYFRRLVEMGILPEGTKPEPFHRLPNLRE